MLVKAFLTAIIFLFACKATLAQTTGQPGNATTSIRICTPSRGQAIGHKVLFVVFLKGKEVIRSTTADSTRLNSINPQFIKSLIVVNANDAIKKYGPVDGAYGVVEVYLKEENYPNGFDKPVKKDTTVNKN
jgi:hypothetical protein